MLPTILTCAGRYYDLSAPEQCAVTIGEIAHALGHICRFTGHVSRFYSVAEHSWHVSHLVPREDALAGLMHDAAEALIGDVSAPLKMLLPDYRQIEARVESAVRRQFGLRATLPPSVKAADQMMLRVEQEQAMGAAAHDWSLPVLSPAAKLVRLDFWDPDEAVVRFVMRFEELTQ